LGFGLKLELKLKLRLKWRLKWRLRLLGVAQLDRGGHLLRLVDFEYKKNENEVRGLGRIQAASCI